MNATLPVVGQRLRALSARRSGVAVWLWGEAGIGKTYTSRALLRGTPCRNATVAATLPLTALVRALPRPARPRAWLQTALDHLQSGQTVAVPTEDVLAALLGQLAPFVLHLEDLHGADTTRKEWIDRLAVAVARTRGAALLVSSRVSPPESWPEDALTLPLERQSKPTSAALMESEAGAALPAEALAWVYERACGNPLFTLEYFRLLARQGHLWNSGDHWRWRAPQGQISGSGPLPVTVEALIEHGLDDPGGSAPAEALLAALALLPESVDDSQLVAVTALTTAELAAARAELHRRCVLFQGHFAHPLYREVALKRLAPARRQALARRAVEAFKNDPQALLPLIQEAHLDPFEAADLLVGVAESTVPGPQHFRLLAQAAEYASGPQRLQLSLRAAQGLRTDDLPEAVRLAEVAARLAPELAEAAHLYAELLALQGRLAEAEACLERRPAEERTGLPWWSRLIRFRGVARNYAGVLELWLAHPEFHGQAEAGVMYAVAFACAQTNRLEQATELANQTLTWPDLDAATRCDLNNVLGIVCYNRGDFAGAATYQGQAVTLARAARLFHLEPVYLHNRAMSLGEIGEFEARLADLGASLRLHLERGQFLQANRAQVTLADAHLDRAHYEQAEELLLEAREFLSRQGPSDQLIECEYRLSVLYRHWGPPHGGLLSLKHGRTALNYARQLGLTGKLVWSLGYAAIAEACFGAASEGRRLAQEALELSAQLNAPGPRGMAQFALAFALEASGQPHEALQAFETTEAELIALGVTDAAQEVGLEADRLAHRPARAAERLAWFESAGMTNLARVTCQYFPDLNLTPPEAGGIRRVSTPPTAAPQMDTLRLDVLGEMRCGPPGAGTAVRGGKRRELLACLLDSRLRGRPDVPRLTLTDALYPGRGESQAASALKELVHQTRTALGAGVIQTSESGYALGNVQSDAELFLQSGDTALWRGPCLLGRELEPSSLMADTLHGALAARAQVLCREQPAEAARVGRLLCEANPYDLSALALTLQALRAAGNHRSLGRFYTSACQVFEEVGEHLPGEWAAFLATYGEQGRPVT
ncbi:tetratricopeptide repeat protein [Deinococcus humi]|uniref:Tetratricopeptide (TPR) repeat protein n=1 Tax=Deinococcus humi TaxID=662880 RepID=A0A7W8JPS3_9DEIO|nr:tetratricopeptide repeat protein [Deinococcus humi]MBB5360966.1 tetratricopeptide (TPR) repeat protein [Deinococcus humi]GGO17829.1 hypothetical protein GCM10008949_00360 [Deinococcus humi]